MSLAHAHPAVQPLEVSDLSAGMARLEEVLERLLSVGDEASVDPRWTRARLLVRGYALRPAKRVRPMLVLMGHSLATGRSEVSPGLLQFAAALEVLHTFLLVHDDVADRAETRRGGASLHRLLAGQGKGEDLAIVAGDHLFALAMEAMLSCGLPGASEAAQTMMAICRHTAAGQYLDLELASAPLAEVSLFQTLKVANLKTARYGFVGPLLCGAMLGGADEAKLEQLERIGRHLGVAFQLRDDLIGLFGDERVTGKSGDSDFYEGKRTFPVIAAYTRADEHARVALEYLWSLPDKDSDDLREARWLLESTGGRSATERVIARASRAAHRAADSFEAGGPAKLLLLQLVAQLARRSS